MTRDEIWRRTNNLRIREHLATQKALAAVHAEFDGERFELRLACENLGHDWRYSSMNFVQTHEIQRCAICSATRAV